MSAEDRSVTDETRTFYAHCGSTLEDVFALHLQQTYNSSLKYVITLLHYFRLLTAVLHVLKDIFEIVDSRNIVGFINNAHFYCHHCSYIALVITSHFYLSFSPFSVKRIFTFNLTVLLFSYFIVAK